MTAVVAFQPAVSRPGPVPIAASRPPSVHRSSSGKQTQLPVKSASTFPAAANSLRAKRERPCDACRRRKSRCVIHEGASLCVLCEFHRQECTFVQSPQPRKRKLVEPRKDPGVKKRSVELDTVVRPSQTPNLVPLRSPNHAASVSVGRSFSGSGETLGLQRSKYSRYLGSTAPFDNIIWGLSEFDTRNESNIDLGTLRKVSDNECFIMVSDEAQDFDDAETLNAIEEVVQPHGDTLIDIYFNVVHPSFPIVQKSIFLHRLRNGDRTFSPPLLAGMYLLALNWWSHDPRLASLPQPDVERLDAIASRSLAASMQRPKLSTVQGGLLLLQRPEADSWSLTTQLVAIGQELGVHLDCTTWSIPEWERGLRRRIAWALYMQDKWSSLIHGRPSHIFGANWAVKPISDADFDESDSTPPNAEAIDEDEKSDTEKGEILFAQMIALTGIMAEIMDTFYTQVAIQEFSNAGKNSTRLILDRAKSVQIRLKDWFAKLPSSVRMDNVTSGRLSATGFLHLAYFATEITLHRRIVQSLDPDTADPYLMYICRSAAKTRLISAMDFVNRLKPEHLQSFWHFAAKINFTLIGTFGGLLLATAPSREEADFYRTRLREYRWTLSVSSRRADFLDYAVQMLDASRAMLSNLAEKPSLTNAHVSSAGVPDAQARSAAAGVHAPLAGQQLQLQQHPQATAGAGSQDEAMEDVSAMELHKFPSGSAFSGFSNTEQFDHLGSRDSESPDTEHGAEPG